MQELTRSSAMPGLTRSSAVAGCPTSPLDTTKECPCELCKDSPGHQQWQDVLPCCWPPPSCQVALACHAGRRSRPELPWFHWPLLCQTGSEKDIEGGCVHILNRLLWGIIQTAVFDYSIGTSLLTSQWSQQIQWIQAQFIHKQIIFTSNSFACSHTHTHTNRTNPQVSVPPPPPPPRFC